MNETPCIIPNMYILYIDESIDKNLIALGATLVSDMKCRKFYQDFEKFISEELQIPSNIEIHADHIWNARGEFTNLNMEKRADTTYRIANFIGESNLSKLYYTQEHIEGRDKTMLYMNRLNLLLDVATSVVSKAGSTNKQLMVIFDQRNDIKQNILVNLEEQRNQIIKRYKSSCFLIDCGYEGISKYSRFLQVADFVAYWGRQMSVIQENSSLFSIADDARKIALVKSIKDSWGSKFKRIN